MTNKQRRALRRERARDKQRKKAVRRAVAVNMQSVRSGAYMAARERQDRFEVDPSLTWYVIRTLPRWATKAAEQITASGTPVFEAREAIRLVSDIGKVRLALIPVLRRLIFVGVKDWQELRHVESHPGVYDDLTGYGRSGVVQRPGGGHMTIGAEDLQNFADCITGVGGDDETALGLIYEIGGVVRVKEGALASFDGNVEAIDERTGRLRISVDIFGRRTTVELDENQVEAA